MTRQISNGVKKNIAVIFGGRSAEHDVSIITAHIPIIQTLVASEQFEVWPVYIAKDGSWYSDQVMNDLNFFKQADFGTVLLTQKKVRILFDHGLTLVWPGLREKKVRMDIVFPSMHGTVGEDGSLMGVLRMADVPFVGCDLFASAVAMDKALTKQVLWAEKIPVVPFVWFTRGDWKVHETNLREQIYKLKWPVFVKPVHLGSSIGIAKIKHLSELARALEVAFHYDDKVLVEESVENLIEVTLPIIGNNELRLGGVERPMNKTEFFDFNDKYLSGGGKSGGVHSEYSQIPAHIGEILIKKVQELGKKTYHILGCAGIARIDFLIDSSSREVYVNEVNALPGSLYHHNWKKVGISNMELVTTLVTLAEERFAHEHESTRTFSSDILKKVGGQKIGE